MFTIFGYPIMKKGVAEEGGAITIELIITIAGIAIILLVLGYFFGWKVISWIKGG